MVLRLCMRSRLFGAVWILATGAFEREKNSVISGRIKHLDLGTERSAISARYNLRRNTHRLEKGLIMRPRRNVFALEYIVETTRDFNVVQEAKVESDADLLAWSHDVLVEYFSIVDQAEPKIADAREIFLQSGTKESSEIPPKPKIPYARDLDSKIQISIESITKLAKRRRSCRWFLPESVPREMIDAAIRVANYSPSACNRQPFEYRIFDEKALVEKIASVPMGTRGFSQNFPCVVVIVGQLSAFPYVRDRHVPYIDASLSAMAFQFALEVQGISSCCINWPDIEEREVLLRETIQLDDDECVVMFLAVGFPDPKCLVPYSQKKPISEIRSYNKTC